jgi:hypothetical protein
MEGLRSVEDPRRRDCPKTCTLHTGAGQYVATRASTNVPTSLKADRFLRSGEDSSLASASPLGAGRSSDSRVESPAFSSLRCGAEAGGAGHDNGRTEWASLTPRLQRRGRPGFAPGSLFVGRASLPGRPPAHANGLSVADWAAWSRCPVARVATSLRSTACFRALGGHLGPVLASLASAPGNVPAGVAEPVGGRWPHKQRDGGLERHSGQNGVDALDR